MLSEFIQTKCPNLTYMLMGFDLRLIVQGKDIGFLQDGLNMFIQRLAAGKKTNFILGTE